MKLRLKFAGVMFAGASLLVLGRLFYWQIIRGDELLTRARSQYLSGSSFLAKRGSILASSGEWLVSSADSWLMYAQMPEITEDIRVIANKLAPLLVEDPTNKEELLQKAMEIEAILGRDDAVWLPIARKLNSDTKRNLEALSIEGIGFDLEEARIYPEASSSAHVLGFVGKNDEGGDRGYFGLEGYYDLLLSGTNGYLERESSAIGIPLLTGEERGTAALGGVNLVTHINKSVQLLVERRLIRGIEQYGAISGNVVVVDPENGGIIAMAAYPAYDPGKYFDFGDTYFKNPIISDSFEPGSIFKPVIMAAGLDSGEVKPETKCDICGAPLKVDKYEIGTWNNEYRADSTMMEVIQHSDNVGMAFVGGKLGADLMYDYLTKFGFGRVTDIDLQGEASPRIRERGKWNVVDVATASFGQGIAVTPIQMVMAVTAIARDGEMVTPQVVDKFSQGDWEEDIESKVGERVISSKAADEITQMMVTAASEGEAKWTADIKLKVAGKTGTAQIPVSGHYDDEKTIASFVGFAPYDKPKFVMLVTLREPQSSPWASETAAPLWYGIAKEMMRYLD